MARQSRGYLARCPRFATAPRSEGREEQCIATHKGYRFKVVRYRKSGRLTAWLLPTRGRGRTTKVLPTSTRSTRSLPQLLDDAVAFVNRVHGRNN